MSTLNIDLTEQREVFIKNLLKSGFYRGIDDIIDESLGLLEEREAQEPAKLEALRSAVQLGIDDIENGNYIEFSEPSALIAHLDRIAGAALSK